MIEEQKVTEIATYAGDAPAEMLIPPGGYPVPKEEYTEGVRPLDTLPAAWWNWLWNKFSKEEQNTKVMFDSIYAELRSVMTAGGVNTPSSSLTNQLATAIENIRTTIATTTTAGAIKTGTAFGTIGTDANGVASMNGAGTGEFDTTAQSDLTSVINELVDRIVALETAPAPESIAPGIMVPYAGATAPSGWLLCQGQAVSRTTYSSLFTAIGTSWGAGDGSTTFNIPDLREAAPCGTGTRAAGASAHDTYTLGEYKDDSYKSHAHGATSTATSTSTPSVNNTLSIGKGTIYGRPSTITSSSGAYYDTNSLVDTSKRRTTLPSFTSYDTNYWYVQSSLSGTISVSVSTSTSVTTKIGNAGDTVTRGKRVGVNYIIKI